MPTISHKQAKQLKEAMKSMKTKDEKKSFLFSLLGYKVDNYNKESQSYEKIRSDKNNNKCV